MQRPQLRETLKRNIDRATTFLNSSFDQRYVLMSQDALSDLLRSVRVRGAVFYYVNCRGQWSAKAPPAEEIAEAVMPGCEHVMEYHMISKGNGWGRYRTRRP